MLGNYEYMPDGSWKGAGTCTRTVKGGDKIYETWQEGSDLKEWVYKMPAAPANIRVSRAAEPTPTTTSPTRSLAEPTKA